MANPSVGRQKSCYACARSKARCDLGYPSCERCRKRQIACVYAPHTGNPNARRAREQELHQIHTRPTRDTYGTPYPVSNVPVMGTNLSESAFRPLNQLMPWSNMSNVSLNMRSSQNVTDTSGDESDGNITTDSLETKLASNRWDSSAGVGPHVATSSAPSTHAAQGAFPYGVGPSPWNSYSQPPVLSSQAADARSSYPDKHRATSPVLGNMFQASSNTGLGELVLPLASQSSQSQSQPLASSSLPDGLMSAATSKMEPPSISFGASNLTSNNEREPRRKSTTELTQICTSNLSVPNNMTSSCTPTRLINMSLFSPAHFGSLFGSNELSMWLDEPVAPSPMYETGACTGWTGLISAIDTGRTPTANSTRMGLIKGPRQEEEANAQRSSASAPALISSVDWWAHDYGAQRRFHRYTLMSLPAASMIRSDDCRSTLSASVSSRFLTYCSFLCLRDPGAPQPPFMHRYMLLSQRDKLPASLSIARSALSALAMRLPTSEEWAWRQVGVELGVLVDQASSLVRQYRPGQAEATPLEKQLWFQQATSWDGCWECLSLLQAMWCYTVVGSFSDSMDRAQKTPTFCSAQNVWDPGLLDTAVEMLEQLMCILATIGVTLQAQMWKSNVTSNKPGQGDTFEFLWWGLCDSIRRTVLATHALLVLWQYTRSSSLGSQGALPSLGIPLISRGFSYAAWKNVMTLELPAVAAVFEADNVTQWRQMHSKNQWRADQPPLNLATFMQYRPLPSKENSDIPFSITSYFHQHDEFTNICMSTLFGLTESC